MSKRGCENRRFTPSEDARLVELRLVHDGVRGRGGLKTIAKKLGRAKSSVQLRLNKLAERGD